VQDGFVFLRGYEQLLEKSKKRALTHRQLSDQIYGIARNFARDLAASCPCIECIALSGSAASGGFHPGDDIDFDLFVEPGTKYICYLLATLIGLRYSWQYRHLRMDESHRTPLLPKLTCINVVWPADQTRPFIRQDAGLAFELLRCEPLVGSSRFRHVLADNPWIHGFFPQIYERVHFDTVRARQNALGRLLAVLTSRPRFRRSLERVARVSSWLLYTSVQRIRARSPVARERMAFLRRVKFPYEVFQD